MFGKFSLKRLQFEEKKNAIFRKKKTVGICNLFGFYASSIIEMADYNANAQDTLDTQPHGGTPDEPI